MLLRSSSTPVLGSLLSSFAESPNNNVNYHHETHYNNLKHQIFHHTSLNKLPRHQTGSLNLTTPVSSSSSPISPSFAEFSDHSHKGFRRAQSEGNLEGLAYASCNHNPDFCSSSQSKKFSSYRPNKFAVLDTIPSFSSHNPKGPYEEDDDEKETDIEDQEEEEHLEEEEALAGGHLCSTNHMENMVLTEEIIVPDKTWNVDFRGESGLICEEMYLARGIGIEGGRNNGNGGNSSGGSSGRGGGREFNSGGGDGDMGGTEEYYKRMVQENPGNPLFLRNYAKYLYQTKQDLRGAEEYYSRAILADPKDGEILALYAQLVWELHHDQDRAASYFERAIQASPEDSHIHSAYASFLWDIEDDEDEQEVAPMVQTPLPLILTK
ncbi:hypothetical protein K2173_013673 [Erythroxylum novogranatense]|uniref:Uncharacterized protein n=1 Tax=Erythroxylum novogranatense TaxID=1862640 RepID=A0AAV8SA10_9ROSI|nr:hypothetical protein K2173_013673 [Erythroxylum novogranatense]